MGQQRRVVTGVLRMFLHALCPPTNVVRRRSSLIHVCYDGRPIMSVFFLFLVRYTMDIRLFFRRKVIFNLLGRSLSTVRVVSTVEEYVLMGRNSVPR